MDELTPVREHVATFPAWMIDFKKGHRGDWYMSFGALEADWDEISKVAAIPVGYGLELSICLTYYPEYPTDIDDDGDIEDAEVIIMRKTVDKKANWYTE